MKFRFGTARLLLATLAFAIPTAAFGGYGAAGVIVGFTVGISLGLITLVVKYNQIWMLIRTAMYGVAGTVVGLLFCPMVDPPRSPGDEFSFMIMGCLIGSACGIAWTGIKQAAPDRT